MHGICPCIDVHSLQTVLSADDDVSCEKQFLDIERIQCALATAASSHGHIQHYNASMKLNSNSCRAGIPKLAGDCFNPLLSTLIVLNENTKENRKILADGERPDRTCVVCIIQH